MLKNILLFVWNTFCDFTIRINDFIHLVWDFFYRRSHRLPKIVGVKESLEFILHSGCSVSRYGDAEMKVAKGMNISYQKNSERLTSLMAEILSVPIKNHIVCLPDVFGDLSKYTKENSNFWRLHMAYFRKLWYKYLDFDRTYYNSFLSRCYMPYKDKSHADEYFSLIKKIWDGRQILLVEGEKSRLGVGNDLFENSKCVKRILAPNLSAFDYFDVLMGKVNFYDKNEWLVLLALGPTATVMAYELAKEGYQAIDIGNIDTEYEWYKMGALNKVPIRNKYVHEAGGYNGDQQYVNQEYESQIVCRL